MFLVNPSSERICDFVLILNGIFVGSYKQFHQRSSFYTVASYKSLKYWNYSEFHMKKENIRQTSEKLAR